MTYEQILQALRLLDEYNFELAFTESGPYFRGRYPKHVAFFEAGSRFKERLFMAANRVGKTTAGAYEAVCHSTGNYPDWWPGRKFSGPNEGWACGTTSETTRDIVQRALFGNMARPGTGMLPAADILDWKRRPHGLPDSLEQIFVRHKSGGVSTIGLKSYEQGRKSFEGTAKHWIWCDEEPPADCYTEMLFRTATTRGITWLTFTPLQGMSQVVQSFLEPEEKAKRHKFYIQAGWNDAPHIPDKEKETLIAVTLPHELLARTEGEPSLGTGAIYPIAEDRILCQEFIPPESWPRSYGMDVGWKWTVAVWGARNPATNVTYLYSEYAGSQEPPAVHAAAIKARGAWIPGTIDPAAAGSNQVDGKKLLDIYRSLGLLLTPADHAVTAGLQLCWEGLVTGTIKVMPSLENWRREFRKYHRDDKGNIVKANDHLMDAWRYRMVTGRNIERTNAVRVHVPRQIGGSGGGPGERGWMS